MLAAGGDPGNIPRSCPGLSPAAFSGQMFFSSGKRSSSWIKLLCCHETVVFFGAGTGAARAGGEGSVAAGPPGAPTASPTAAQSVSVQPVP